MNIPEVYQRNYPRDRPIILKIFNFVLKNNTYYTAYGRLCRLRTLEEVLQGSLVFVSSKFAEVLHVSAYLHYSIQSPIDIFSGIYLSARNLRPLLANASISSLDFLDKNIFISLIHSLVWNHL